MHRIFLIFILVILASCSDPRASAKNRLKGLDTQALRFDAAKLYKQIYAAPGPDYFPIKQSQWPQTFSTLGPVSVSCHRDGISVVLTDDPTHETGLHIQPLGISTPPSAASIKFERIEEGIYWYSLSK